MSKQWVNFDLAPVQLGLKSVGKPLGNAQISMSANTREGPAAFGKNMAIFVQFLVMNFSIYS
jgi:hypothetical protein